MSKLRVNCFAISLDGYGAGPNQSQQDPLGKGGTELHEWFYPTRTFKSLFGDPSGGTTGVDDDFARKGTENLGAWILGRNMFAPTRGPWLDDAWRGWWGKNPPYHVPVFVLTHHARPPLEMEGGTTFHFVTGGIEQALEQAREAAGARDVRVGGGTQTIRQYLRAGLIDQMHLAISPVLLGSGEHLLRDLDLRVLGYQVTGHVAGEKATHVTFERQGARTQE
jgi:dihydrofolate reductase